MNATDIDAQILAHIANNPGTVPTIAAAIGKGVSATRMRLNAMAKAGQITRTRNGHNALSYSLPQAAAPIVPAAPPKYETRIYGDQACNATGYRNTRLNVVSLPAMPPITSATLLEEMRA